MLRIPIARCLFVIAAISACGPNHSSRYGTMEGEVQQCPGGATVPGLDVSHYDGTVNWANVASDGFVFGYAKATEGLATTDSQFQANWAGMKTHGILRGAYHFLRASEDGAAQADFFLASVGAMGQSGDLPPMLDWEMSDGVSSATQVRQAQAFIDEIHARTGLTTIVYTYPSFWNGLSGTGQFSAYPLWIANYGVSCPALPPPWSKWTFWQSSDTGSTTGVSGNIDLDVFNGTLADLQALAGMSATPAFAPPAQASGNDAITLVNWADGHMDVFARTPGGEMMHSTTAGAGDAWSPPAALDGSALCGSAAAFWGGAWLYPELFSSLDTGGTGHLWYGMTSWLSYRDFGGSGLSHLSTAVGNDGRAEVFALGPDGAIWQNYWNADVHDWSGWGRLGGTFVTGVGTATWGNGTVELFATDAAGAVWHSWSDSTSSGGWATWEQLGGPSMSSQPVAVRWDDGRAGHAEIFARGADGQLYHSNFSYTADWPALSVVSAGTRIEGRPSAVMNGADGPEVFARSPSGSVLHLAWNGSGYSVFSPIGSEVVASDPFGWMRADGALEVFAIDGYGNLVRTMRGSGGSWSAWSAIGSGFDSCETAEPPPPDAGTPIPDAGSPHPDAGPPDAGLPHADAGTPIPDAGPPHADAGTPIPDAGHPLDAGPSPIDAGHPDDAGHQSGIDAGEASDDAGVGQPRDAGNSSFNIPVSPKTSAGHSGCGCGTNEVTAIAWVIAIVGLRRRRRHWLSGSSTPGGSEDPGLSGSDVSPR